MWLVIMLPAFLSVSWPISSGYSEYEWPPGIAHCPSDQWGAFFSAWCLMWAALAPSLLVKQDLHGVCYASLSLLSVLSPPSPSLYQAWTRILATGVSHHYEPVWSVRGAVGRIGVTSRHFFPGIALPPQSWWSQTCDIMWAGFQEWLLTRSFSVWSQCRLLALDHRKRLYTWQPPSIFTTHAFVWTCWPVGLSLPLSGPMGKASLQCPIPVSRWVLTPGAGCWGRCPRSCA